MSKRQQLMEAIREVLTRDKAEDYFCQHGGKFYRFEDIDKITWAPTPGRSCCKQEHEAQRVIPDWAT